MKTRRAKLVLNPVGKASSIEIDGLPVPGVAGVHLDGGVHGMPSLTLNLVLHEVEVEGEMVVEVREKAHLALLALGWTPPHDMSKLGSAGRAVGAVLAGLVEAADKAFIYEFGDGPSPAHDKLREIYEFARKLTYPDVQQANSDTESGR